MKAGVVDMVLLWGSWVTTCSAVKCFLVWLCPPLHRAFSVRVISCSDNNALCVSVCLSVTQYWHVDKLQHSWHHGLQPSCDNWAADTRAIVNVRLGGCWQIELRRLCCCARCFVVPPQCGADCADCDCVHRLDKLCMVPARTVHSHASSHMHGQTQSHSRAVVAHRCCMVANSPVTVLHPMR
jgi:hypothetical protein